MGEDAIDRVLDNLPNLELSRVRSPDRRTAVRSLRKLLRTSGLPSELQISDHPRSGRNSLYVLSGEDRRWLAKAGATGAESWFYREVGASLTWVPASIPVRDPAVTLTDYLENVKSLAEVAVESPGEALGALASLAPLLAELHDWSPSPASSTLPAARPALAELAPVHVSEWLDGTEGSLHLLRSIQSRAVLCRALNGAISGLGPQGLTHSDLKADNILLRPEGAVIVDWELCGYGHLGWDLGSVVGSMLAIWTEGVDLQDTPPTTWLRDTPLPYKDVCDAACQLMVDYRQHAARDVPSTETVATYAASWLTVRSWAESLAGRFVNPRHLLRLVVAEGLLRNPTALFRGIAP